MVHKTGKDESFFQQGDTSFEDQRLKQFAKQMLKGQIFVGHFKEKRHVEKIQLYRDVIEIPKQELKVIEALKQVKHHIMMYYPTDSWIGIVESSPTENFSVWVNLPKYLQFGMYWFIIKGLKVTKSEIFLSVEVKRPYQPTEVKTTSSENLEESDFEQLNHSLEEFKNTCKRNLSALVINASNPSNVRSVIQFLSVFTVAFVTGSFELLKFSSKFLIDFMYALSHFMNTMAPFAQMILNCLENMFKYVCILFAYLFKGNVNTRSFQSYQQQPQRIGYYSKQRALPSSGRSGVTITEMN